MRNKPLTRETLLGMWDHLEACYGTTTVIKEQSPLMRAAARSVHLLGILDRKRFMDGFTTVVGRRIYAPFVPGGPEVSLFNQLVTCVHEHQHVVQIVRDGRARMWSTYLGSPRARAVYEAEAYSCNLELSWWYQGAHPRPAELASRLQSYGCRASDIEVAERILAGNALRVRSGEVVTEASRVAIAWLDAA